jgi:hypothetical protein
MAEPLVPRGELLFFAADHTGFAAWLPVGTNSTQEGKSSVHETSVHGTYIRSADETPCLCRAFEARGEP